jgi:hypothetical protein
VQGERGKPAAHFYILDAVGRLASCTPDAKFAKHILTVANSEHARREYAARKDLQPA